MNRMWAAAAAVIGLAGVSLANDLPGGGGERYGINPLFRGLLFKKKACPDGGCVDSSRIPPPPGSGLPGSAGAAMPGTLVFPHHYYIRSPRDWFMVEPK